MPYLATGRRVAIRPFTPADGEEFTAAARASTGLHRPWLFPPRTAEEYARYAGRFDQEPGPAGFLVCGLADGGRIAGFVAVNNIVHGAFRSAALGYGAFAHAAGRGLMGEGLGLVIGHAFGPAMGLHRLEGYSPRFLYVDGDWRDHERWAITAEERPAR